MSKGQVPPVMIQPSGQAPPQQQPGQQQWMPLPPAIPGCPRGLEYLTQLDQILIHQQIELFEAITGIETKNRYQVKNSLGQQFYFAYEESEFCMRICCGPNRGFMMHIIDNQQQEIMRVVRPFQCCHGCCWCAEADCCAFTISVESPPGTPIGFVRQRGSAWKPHLDIIDQNHDPILKIRGPCCFCQAICCTCDIDFRVMSYDETQQVGKVSKQWGGLARECFTKADNFGISFPVDLDVKVKATLMAATFLIEFMYFEREKNNN